MLNTANWIVTHRPATFGLTQDLIGSIDIEQRRLLVVPQPPRFVDLPQSPVGGDAVQRGVDLLGQRFVLWPKGDGIVASRQRRPYEFQLGVLPSVVQRDGQVEQHGIQSAVFQVAVRLDLAVVDSLADLLFVQQAFGGRVLQRADRAADRPALFDRLETRIVRANHQLQRVHVIRMAEPHHAGPIGCDLDAVHGKVEIPPLQSRHEAAELVLDEFDPPPQVRGQRLGDFHFKADVGLGLVRVLENVRRSALGIRCPTQRRQIVAGRFGGRRRRSFCAGQQAGDRQQDAGDGMRFLQTRPFL
jgi:hypothetical protein